MRLGLGLWLSTTASIAFSPASLFAASEPGVWYDPSDLTTLFQDAAGTIPVTAAGQSVGLVLDKSKGLALGPERLTNGDFASGATGWTVSGEDATHTLTFADGKVRFQSDTTTPILDLRQAVLVAGKTYEVTIVVSDWVSGSIKTDCRGTTDMLAIGIGTFKLRLLAANSSFNITRGSTNVDLTIESVSVREILGHHATQSTAAARPTYGVEPLGGRRNLLTYTEQFDNAAWTKQENTISVNVATAPDGTTTADKLVENTARAVHQVFLVFTYAALTTYTQSIFVKPAGRTKVRFSMGSAAFGGVEPLAIYDLSLGTVESVSNATANIYAVGDGWFRIVLTATSDADGAVGVGACAVRLWTTTGSYTGDGTSGLFVWGAQIEVGTITPYQRVTTAFDVTEAGVPSLSYLSFDGVDDWLTTASMPLAAGGRTIISAVRKRSDDVAGAIVETQPMWASAAGGFAQFAPSPSGPATYGSRVNTSVMQSLVNTPASYAAPHTAMLSSVITAGSHVARVNGQQVAIDALTGTLPELSAALAIGSRAGSVFFAQINMYGLILRFGPNLTADQITQTETWLNSKTGAY